MMGQNIKGAILIEFVRASLAMAKEAVRTHKSSSHKSKHKSHVKKSSAPIKDDLLTLTQKVLGAVKQYFAKIDEDSVDLVEKRRQIFVSIGFDKCPLNPDLAHHPLKLECPVNVCSRGLLIVRDEATKIRLEEDDELTARFPLIIDLKSLKNNFSTKHLRSNLFKDHDAFYCDRRIIVDAAGFLGHEIRNSWRRPIEVKIPAIEHLGDLTAARESLIDNYTYLTSFKIAEAANCTIRIGALTGDTAELAKNLVAAVQAVRSHINEREADCAIQSISLLCSKLNVQLVEPIIKNIRIEVKSKDDAGDVESETSADD